MMVRILFCGLERFLKAEGAELASGFLVVSLCPWPRPWAVCRSRASTRGRWPPRPQPRLSSPALLLLFSTFSLGFLQFCSGQLLLPQVKVTLQGGSVSCRFATPPQGHSQYLETDLQRKEHVKLLIVHWISLRRIHLPPGGKIHKVQH